MYRRLQPEEQGSGRRRGRDSGVQSGPVRPIGSDSAAGPGFKPAPPTLPGPGYHSPIDYENNYHHTRRRGVLKPGLDAKVYANLRLLCRNGLQVFRVFWTGLVSSVRMESSVLRLWAR